MSGKSCELMSFKIFLITNLLLKNNDMFLTGYMLFFVLLDVSVFQLTYSTLLDSIFERF